MVLPSLILGRSRSFAAFVTRSLPSVRRGRERERDKSREQPGPSENQARFFLVLRDFKP